MGLWTCGNRTLERVAHEGYFVEEEYDKDWWIHRVVDAEGVHEEIINRNTGEITKREFRR